MGREDNLKFNTFPPRLSRINGISQFLWYFEFLNYYKSAFALSCHPGPELRNVNSFIRSKILELNFTPRKARQFWHLSQIKCAKRIVLVNKCWQFYQIRPVYTQKSCIIVQIFPKKAKFGQITSSPRLFNPTCKYFYTNIFVIFVTFRNSVVDIVDNADTDDTADTVIIVWHFL